MTATTNANANTNTNTNTNVDRRANVALTSHVPASGLERVFTIRHENYQPASGKTAHAALMEFIMINRLKRDPDLD